MAHCSSIGTVTDKLEEKVRLIKKKAIISSDNGMSPIWPQVIIRTNIALL